MGENIPFRTKADYDNYLARLALVPARMKAYGDISVKAAREGYVAAVRCDERRSPGRSPAMVPPTSTKSPFYAPFAASAAARRIRAPTGRACRRGRGT